MRKREPTFFRDQWGDLRAGWELLILVTAVAFIVAVLSVGIMFGIWKPIEEAGCNQQADELAVVDGDYRLLSDTCYLTLPFTGEVIPADRYRAVEGVEP